MKPREYNELRALLNEFDNETGLYPMSSQGKQRLIELLKTKTSDIRKTLKG